MIDLLTVEKEFISSHIKKGGVAADFTMGNGHDTLWLSRQVGEEGRVYAFDIQPAALEHTRALLESSDCPENYTLIGTQADQKKFIGNAVEVNIARVLCEALVEEIVDELLKVA